MFTRRRISECYQTFNSTLFKKWSELNTRQICPSYKCTFIFYELIEVKCQTLEFSWCLFPLLQDGGMKHLQICMLDNDFYLHQVRVFHLVFELLLFRNQKISEFCRCHSHLAVFNDNDYWIFSALHTDTDFRYFI